MMVRARNSPRLLKQKVRKLRASEGRAFETLKDIDKQEDRQGTRKAPLFFAKGRRRQCMQGHKCVSRHGDSTAACRGAHDGHQKSRATEHVDDRPRQQSAVIHCGLLFIKVDGDSLIKPIEKFWLSTNIIASAETNKVQSRSRGKMDAPPTLQLTLDKA